MDKESQIEELEQKIIYAINKECALNNGGHCNNCPLSLSDNDCQSRLVAKSLYNAGYRKTFTSDLASDTQKAFKDGYIKGSIDRMNECYKTKDEVRKETAREILQKMKERMSERDYMGVKYRQGIFSENDIDELLNEYEKDNDLI